MKEAPKQQFYEPQKSSNLDLSYLPGVPVEQEHHFFLRANIVIVLSLFALVIVLLIGGVFAIHSKQDRASKKSAASAKPTPSIPVLYCGISHTCPSGYTCGHCTGAIVPGQPAPDPNKVCSCYPTDSEPFTSPSPSNEGVFCTQEAKLCPDGSYVGRQGPNCDFAPCP